MKSTHRIVTWLLPAVLAAGMAASAPALAQHHFHGGPRVHFGVVIGAPLYPNWYYPPPRYYYPAPVVVQSQPPVYIEQPQQLQQQAAVPPESASADAASYWYFCRESNTYYPYVKSCASPWQRVTPQQPPG